MCLQRGPLTLDLWEPYGPFLCPDPVHSGLFHIYIYLSRGVDRGIFPEEKKKETEQLIRNSFIVFISCHLAEWRRKKMEVEKSVQDDKETE